MARINPVTDQHVDSETQSTLAGVRAKLGMVPNLLATLAHSPAALHSYLQVSDQLGSGRLNDRQREIVALAVGQYNECQYCLSAHTLLGKNAGLDPVAIQQARRGAASDALDNAVARLAHRIAAQRGVLSDSELEELRAAGLDDGLVIEIVANVALNTLTNYVNHIAGTEIDFPVVDLQAA